jgi:hypothetical protein
MKDVFFEERLVGRVRIFDPIQKMVEVIQELVQPQKNILFNGIQEQLFAQNI